MKFVSQQKAIQVDKQSVFDSLATLAGVTSEQFSVVTTVYTDGGCDIQKNGLGAWAFHATLPDGTIEQRVDAMYGSTNNRMEMRAVKEALETLEIGPPIMIISDSEYVIKGCTMWARNWSKNGWTTKGGEPVKNKDLWLDLVALVEVHNVSFKHVKGHSGHPVNDHVDKLCTKSMLSLHLTDFGGNTPPMDPGSGY